MTKTLTHIFFAQPLRRCLLLLGAALLSCACQSSSSVVSENAATPAPPASSPAPASSAAPAASPTATVAVSAAQTPANPAASPAPSAPVRQSAGAIPLEISTAKPALTPAPDPFKARPTPTVVRKEGKIVQPWPADPQSAGMSNPYAGKPEAVVAGRALYMQRCADCHGKEGKGTGWLSAQLKRDGKPIAPTNLASEVVRANTDGELFWKITNGKSPMPANHQRFTDDERWQIVTFLRTLK